MTRVWIEPFANQRDLWLVLVTSASDTGFMRRYYMPWADVFRELVDAPDDVRVTLGVPRGML